MKGEVVWWEFVELDHLFIVGANKGPVPAGDLSSASFTVAEGPGSRCHPVGGGRRSCPVGCSVFVVGGRDLLAGAAGASCGWRGGCGGLWRRRRGRRGRGAGCVFDGGVDEGQTFGNVFGSRLAAFR